MKYIAFDMYKSKCLGCGSEMRWIRGGELPVKCYSDGSVKVTDNYYTLYRPCENPLCEWSKVKANGD